MCEELFLLAQAKIYTPGDVEGGGLVTALKSDMSDISYQG
jgi:hypothetical protein